MSQLGSGRGSVLAAMSGGVDSSTMATLLVEAGYDVVGVTMELLPEGAGIPAEAREAAQDDLRAARATCQALGIPHHAVDFSARFLDQVVEPFCRSYLEGRTPNPCIDCNRHLKIAGLQQLRREMGLGYVATGHYARVSRSADGSRWQLRQAADRAKDQSYVLFCLGQDDLAHLLLPLGGLTKEQVRALAAEHGLANADRPESQDICFVPDGDYAAFIEGRGAGCASEPALEPGPIVDGRGAVLGAHNGIARYTIGQRKGLGVAAREPLYVCAKDAATNTLVVGPADEAMGRLVVAHDVNLVSAATLKGPLRVAAKTHYRQAPQAATAWQPEPGTLAVEFDEPQRLAAAGQALVVYDGDRVLAGGTIAPSPNAPTPRP